MKALKRRGFIHHGSALRISRVQGLGFTLGFGFREYSFGLRFGIRGFMDSGFRVYELAV